MSRIAIIGAGVSGLVCAHRLGHQHEVELFEANDYAGGHTATVDVPQGDKTYAIDTGFIVFNDRTYPRFQALLDKLEVAYQATEMSFSVNNPVQNLIYNGNSINSLFCQRRNLLSPRFWSFVREILRFNAACKRRHTNDDYDDVSSLGEFLRTNNYSEFFAQNYLLPMGAAIWSSSLNDIEAMPLKFFSQFFYNHGLLDVSNRPQWFTIKGGSRSYVQALLQRCQASVHLSTPTLRIARNDNGVTVTTANGEHHFDQVIMACHSDQALALIERPSVAEREILSAIPYRKNHVVLHQDARLLPPIKTARASWNYHCSGQREAPAAVTYSMNILQRLPADAPLFNVTLNNSTAIDTRLVLREFSYSHPVFSTTMVAAQKQRAKICGVDKIHFCGAYWYNGFHEDGVRSADDVCARLLTA